MCIRDSPISVHRWNPDSSTIEFLYQVVGEGTEKLAQLKRQDTLDVYKRQVLALDSDGILTEKPGNCHMVWNRDTRCENCISRCV